jgi:3-hydroxyisobutyrate dehydrogenase-like beta-hydroxyacid dehydrogenase
MTTPITVLGLGPMGRALARAFAGAGHPTTVWNRTPPGGPARGTVLAGSVAEAVRASRIVVVCLRDHDVVRSVLDPVTDWAGRTLVDLTSGPPHEAERTAAWATGRGAGYLGGAVLTPAPSIGTPAAAVLYSGSEEVHAELREALGALGGTARYVGAAPGRAGAYEMALLDLFATAVHGVVHGFALAAAEGIPAGELAPLAAGIGSLLPEMITRFARQIDVGRHPGDPSTIGSARAGIRHVLGSAAAHGLDVGALGAARDLLERSIRAGHADQGLSRLAVDLRRGSDT